MAHVRRAVLLALIWAVTWMPLGLIAGLILDPDGTMDEPWIAAGTYPGFLSGLIFAAALAITSAQRPTDKVSLSRAAVLGALSGLLVIVPPFTGMLGTPNTGHTLWKLRFLIIAGITLMSVISAIASVVLARVIQQRVVEQM